MTKVLITGASGYLGARLFLDLRDKFEVTGTYNSNQLYREFIRLDTTNQSEVAALVQKTKPEVIIHAAANAHRDWCEEHQDLARKLNIEATRFVAYAADQVGSKLIFISSFAANNTDNFYGYSKKESEEIIKNTLSKYLIIRPPVIIGCSPKRKTTNLFGKILESFNHPTEPVKISTRKNQPCYIGHISQIITLAIERDLSGQTLPVALEEIKTRYEIANDILSPFNIEVLPLEEKSPPITLEKMDKLRELNLPLYQYKDVIDLIVDEIKHRERFRLD